MPLPRWRQKSLVDQLCGAFEVLSATEWEPLAVLIASHMANESVLPRGQTRRGNPRGYTLDGYSHGARIVVEAGVEAAYFMDLSKPVKDLEHAVTRAPTADAVYLMSSQVAEAAAGLDAQVWAQAESQTRGINILLCDAQRSAEYIVSEILPDSFASGELGAHLELIRDMADEYEMSHQVPPRADEYLERADVVAAIEERLRDHQVAVLFGMTGLGKSQAAIAVAEAAAESLQVIWVSGIEANSAADLRSVDVVGRGTHQNLLGMLRTRSCLLVLDDFSSPTPLKSFIAQLRTEASDNAKILVTSQVASGESYDVALAFLSEAEAETILVADCDDPLPRSTFASIWSAVGGHPLALRLLNATATESGWGAVLADVARIGALPLNEGHGVRRLVDVLMERWRPALADALELFLWVEGPRIHRGFARHALPPAILRVLTQRALVTEGEPDVLRLHDIIWSSIRDLKPPITPDDATLTSALERYVERVHGNENADLELRHLGRLHESLLERKVYAADCSDGPLYVWLISSKRLEPQLDRLPDPVARATSCGAKANLSLSVRAAIELAELFAWKSPSRHTEGARDELLRPFEELLATTTLPVDLASHVQHHRAKALKRLGRHSEALAVLESLLRKFGPIPASRLLLARMLSERPLASDPTNASKARSMLVKLTEELLSEPNKHSVTVTLAAVALLRRNVLKIDVLPILERHSRALRALILKAGVRSLEQGVLTLAALGVEWNTWDAEDFSEIVDTLSMPSAEYTRGEESEAWGEVLRLIAQRYLNEDKTRALEEALRFFSQSSSSYATGHIADILTELQRPHDAASALNELIARQPAAVADAWVLLRLSRAEAMLAQNEAALMHAREAWSRAPAAGKHRNRFLTNLSERLRESGLVSEAEHLEETESSSG